MSPRLPVAQVQSDTDGLRCPECGSLRHTVIFRRLAEGKFRRRRQCECGHRFTTVENLEPDTRQSRAGR